jgi:Protein of unknown function (DUF1579)
MNLRPVSLSVAAWILAASAVAQEPPKPTEEHKILAADEGTWDATVKSYVNGPTAEPSVSKGTEVNEVMVGGLWVLSRFDGEVGGTKFQGRGQFGFDPLKKKYVGTWVDSMTATISLLEGSYDAKTRTMTYVGDGVDPSTKMKYTQRMVTTMKADGTRAFTLYMKFEGRGDEMKLMEVAYTKRK